MSDSEDQNFPLHRITKSALKRTVPGQESLTDNANRPRTSGTTTGAGLGNSNKAKAAKKAAIGVTVLNNPNTARVSSIKATHTRGAALDERAYRRPPRANETPIGGANNFRKAKTAAKTSISRDPHPGEHALDQRPATRDQSRPGELHTFSGGKLWYRRFH